MAYYFTGNKMNWYLIIKFLHILAVIINVGGLFARQLVRNIAKKSDDLKTVAALIQAALHIDNVMVIPRSNIMVVMGVILAVMMKWPIFGFFARRFPKLVVGIQSLIDRYNWTHPRCVYSAQQKNGGEFANCVGRRTYYIRIGNHSR
jgi:uncharacterized membrane protein